MGAHKKWFTCGGDRWARVLGGQIDRLSLPLHRVDADCSGLTSLKARNLATPKTHDEIHSSAATATTSRRLETKHVPRVSPYSPASIDPGFIGIGLVQLSQSVKTTNVAHTQIDGQTDSTNNGTLYAPRNEDTFLPYTQKRPRSLRSLSLASLLVAKRNEARPLHTCSRPCAFQEKNHEKRNTKSRGTHNTPRNPHQPDDRDHLETACSETRPTR